MKGHTAIPSLAAGLDDPRMRGMNRRSSAGTMSSSTIVSSPFPQRATPAERIFGGAEGIMDAVPIPV
jgi:hypothetical protein